MLFLFTQITEKNLQFLFKNRRFSTFTTFSLDSWSSVDADFCISAAYATSGTIRSFWLQNIPVSGRLKRKKHKKKHEILAFRPLLQEIRLKTLTIRKVFWSSKSKFWNLKKKTCCRSLPKWIEIELFSPPPIWFYQKSSTALSKG